MKANELMNGDLVMYGGQLCRFVIDSNGAHVERLSDGGQFPPCADVEPIPLTEDILKANGWTKQFVEYYEYMWKSPAGCTYLMQYHTHGEICLEDTDIELNSVHILQHALRLCGLAETADNLKL